MNYLGIDYGKAKIGLALAKNNVKVATPFRIVKSINDISNIIAEEKIDEIVVGYPLSLSGNKSDQTREVDKFIDEIRKLGKPVYQQDERFSSRAAVSDSEDDASAASLILQTYLEKL